MKIIRYFLKFLFGLFSLLIAYLIIAFIASNIQYPYSTNDEIKNNTVYISTNGVHTDIILHKDDVTDLLRTQLDLKPTTNYYAFGWGDKGFYLDTPQWKDLKVSTAINAAFLPSSTAMHVTGYIKTTPKWYTYSISNESLDKLKKYIESSFQINDLNIELIKGHSYGLNDRFFEASGNYSCFKSCNTWTNTALKQANIPTAIWTPFDWGVYKFIQD